MNSFAPGDVTFTAALLRAALGEATRGEPDQDDYETAISYVGARNAMEVLALVRPLADHANPRVRAFMADIVGALFRTEEPPTPDPFVALLSQLLDGEDSSLVLISIGHAFAESLNPAGAEKMTAFARHPDPEVRAAVVQALIAHQGPGPVEALIALSSDSDETVRRDATFALASQHESLVHDSDSPLVDTEALREALVARLDDSHESIRTEAFQGLVWRRDPRVLPAILAGLEAGPENELVVESARLMASPLLYPALRELINEKDHAKRKLWESFGVEAALAACAPSREPERVTDEPARAAAEDSPNA